MPNQKLILTLSLSLIIILSCNPKPVNSEKIQSVYQPDDSTLYATIVKMDSIYFSAYNNCDMAIQAAIYSDTLEFYHDKGGLDTSKQHILQSLKDNICGKVTRHLVAGSIEVYPIANYGAVELGQHYFKNNQEAEPANPSIGKFVLLWQLQGADWKIKRVISLH